MQDRRRDGEIVNIRREEGPLYVHRIKGVFNIKRKKANIFYGCPGLGFVSWHVSVRYYITVLSKTVKHRLRELSAAARGSQDAGSRNLVFTF